MEEQREAHVMTQNGGCTSVLPPKIDFFGVHLTKKSHFVKKNGFFPLIPNPQKVDFAKDFWLIWPMIFLENPPIQVGFSQAQK